MKRKLTSSDFALWAALPMAQTSQIEGRLKMILDTTCRRAAPQRFLALAVAGGAAVLVPLSMLRPAVQAAPVAVRKQAIRQAAKTPSNSDGNNYVGDVMLESQGHSLKPQAAAALERRIALQPDDDADRFRLLGYYRARRISKDPLVSAPAMIGIQQQVFWFIRNQPASEFSSDGELMLFKRDSPAAFDKGKALWLEQVAKQPGNTKILLNAASYCLGSSDAPDDATTEKLLRRGQAMEPARRLWPWKLGDFYKYQSLSPGHSADARRQLAKKALTEYEAAEALDPDGGTPHNTSSDLARMAFNAGEYGKARQYASDLLVRAQNNKGWSSVDDIHTAHLILGRLALRGGDIAGAEAHLLAMGNVPGSAVLDSFGPNMQLAQDLLKAGQHNTVLAYLDECAKFWTYKPGEVSLKTWKAKIRRGEIPNFSANLIY